MKWPRWRRPGLFLRFVLVLGALALLPAAFLAVELTGISQRGMQAAVLELHTKMAEKLAEQVEVFFKVTDDKLAFALASLHKGMDWEDKRELLRSLIETQTDVVEIGILDARGRELGKVCNPDLGSDPRLRSFASAPGWREAARGRRRTRSVVRYRAEPALEMFYPVGPRDWARVLVSLRSLEDHIVSERIGDTGFAVLLDGKGEVLFYPRDRLTPAAAAGISVRPAVQEALRSRSVGSRNVPEFAGLAWVSAYAPVAAIGGVVFILQQRQEAYASAIQMRRAAVWVLLLVSAAAVLAATFLARRLSLPVLSLTRGAEAVSRGDFQARVDVRTGDELQDLAETFNTMASELHRYSALQVDRLLAQQLKTEAVLFSTSDGIIMLDEEGRVQLANRRVRELLGLNAALRIEGRSLREVMPDSSLRELVLQSCADPRPDKFKDIDLSTETSRRCLRISALPVVAPATGAALGVVTTVRDVSFEKELDRMKEEFLHYITHDLRNPLTSAMGFVDVLLKGTAGALNPRQHDMVAMVKRSCGHLMGMVNNILDIAKLESGHIQPQLRPASLADISGRALALLEPLAAQKSIKLALAAAGESSVEADAALIERVVINLVGNAIKFTPKSGAVTVNVVDAGSEVRVSVADTGEGIPSRYLDRIFQKFEQVAGQRHGGTGLGLTISKYFVEAHLGRIWVESQVGKGSRFTFAIPKGLSVDGSGTLSVDSAPPPLT
ncbi:MAG: ATP-binding protein [Elusimicrobia bacterium]|nr:ATP-binding protein [Elusimicrobiota bacterium]